MTLGMAQRPCAWMKIHCSSLDGQFVFLDPQWWDTHLLSAGAALIIREAAVAIEGGQFETFLREIDDAGGWPPGLERLARTLLVLGASDDRCEATP